MALITIPASPERGSLQSYSLDQSDLIALVSDSYFQDKANWQKVVLTYVSSVSNQLSIISFTPSEIIDEVSAMGFFSAEARDAFQVSNISIYDKQNGRYRIERADIPSVGNYDVAFEPPLPPFGDAIVYGVLGGGAATEAPGKLYKLNSGTPCFGGTSSPIVPYSGSSEINFIMTDIAERGISFGLATSVGSGDPQIGLVLSNGTGYFRDANGQQTPIGAYSQSGDVPVKIVLANKKISVFINDQARITDLTLAAFWPENQLFHIVGQPAAFGTIASSPTSNFIKESYLKFN